MPAGVGQIRPEPRRRFPRQMVLVGEVKARVVGHFHADLRLPLERGEGEDESVAAHARRLGREEQRKVARKRRRKDLEGGDVDGVVAAEDPSGRTRRRRGNSARNSIRPPQVEQQIRRACARTGREREGRRKKRV